MTVAVVAGGLGGGGTCGVGVTWYHESGYDLAVVADPGVSRKDGYDPAALDEPGVSRKDGIDPVAIGCPSPRACAAIALSSSFC